ncbi:MAG: hypothetical protein KAS32_30595, partial [Candidatus Peribacteraceae bacterium]|nr:hypothetical protein [Candidatus Peribacteraceae bacterium]
LEDDGISYNWVIEGMAIGATEEISYTISRIPLLVGSFIVVFCVIALLGMGTVKVRAPNIKKKYIKKGNDHLIILEIRGPMAKTLNNVLVKDRVSPLGKVMPEFDGPKPVVRESETGTELIWRIGDMKPRSEIFLTYKIKPLIDAQQLKMPRAHLTYRTADERKINVFSKQIVLE